jgi:hypothetical protein
MAIVQEKKVASNHTAPAATTEVQKENTEKMTTSGSGERDARRSSAPERGGRFGDRPREESAASNLTAPVVMTEVQKENTEKTIGSGSGERDARRSSAPERGGRYGDRPREESAASNHTAPVAMTEVQKENTEKTTQQVLAKETSEDLQPRKEVAVLAIVREKKAASNLMAPVAMTEVQKENTEKTIQQVLAKETPEDLQHQKEVAVLAIVQKKKVVSNHPAPVAMTEVQKENTEKIQSVMAVQSLQAELFPKPEGSIPKVKKKHLQFQL